MVSKSTISTEFLGLEMASPIILLSGCVGFGDEYSRLEGFSNSHVGGVVLKGTTLEPRLGNEPHRVIETPSGMLNSIGLQNPGAKEVVDTILPKLEPLQTHYIANVSGSTIEEYVDVCRAFDNSLVAAIELNISCPNVKKGGMEFGNDPEMSAQVVESCRKVTAKPIITKLSPNQADIQLNAKLCIEAGTDALAVINTISGLAIDINKKELILGNRAGGLSGPAIKPIALKKVYDVYQVSKKHGVPIMGQGGISSPEDAIEFILAGASTVGVGTALFFDPLICNKINQGLEAYLGNNGLKNVNELVGGLV
jgi:dihydroorotate dehydrogenase (NAD+) catalytic subunit|tara:strand:- start:2628 stop:3557 length:930 start_codon:yes stop_codon:yes gene_type:complete